MMSSDLAVSPLALPSCRILCVDDEPAIRDVLRLLLSREGHTVETAADGREAWSRLRTNLQRYDVVITDNEMPHLTGLALVEHLKSANFPGAIIAFSASLTPETRRRLEAWDVTVVEKGSSIPNLRSALRGAIERQFKEGYLGGALNRTDPETQSSSGSACHAPGLVPHR